uniref:Uncharacterized protein n=1 Tax=Anopheles funestus TaxID=62324 RepID=A0A182S1I8_ANOFN
MRKASDSICTPQSLLNYCYTHCLFTFCRLMLSNVATRYNRRCSVRSLKFAHPPKIRVANNNIFTQKNGFPRRYRGMAKNECALKHTQAYRTATHSKLQRSMSMQSAIRNNIPPFGALGSDRETGPRYATPQSSHSCVSTGRLAFVRRFDFDRVVVAGSSSSKSQEL